MNMSFYSTRTSQMWERYKPWLLGSGNLTSSLCLLPAPNDKMKEVLMRTMEEAKALISKVSITANTQSSVASFTEAPCFYSVCLRLSETSSS